MANPLIPEKEWAQIQRRIPIVCVDILTLQCTPEPERRIQAVGLILRDTPHQGQRWCLVGGRIRHNESLGEAITRQMRDTLGPRVTFTVDDDEQPLYVGQYFPEHRSDFPMDPRKHAIGLTYWLEVGGSPMPREEALLFEWFPPDHLPPRERFGFEQDLVVYACLDRLRERFRFAPSSAR